MKKLVILLTVSVILFILSVCPVMADQKQKAADEIVRAEEVIIRAEGLTELVGDVEGPKNPGSGTGSKSRVYRITNVRANASVLNIAMDIIPRTGGPSLRGEPIAGVDVNLGKNPGGSIVITSPTDQNGFYRFTGLTPGTYDLSIAGQRVETINIGAEGTISGKVVNSSSFSGSSVWKAPAGTINNKVTNDSSGEVGRAEEANNALMGVSTTRGMNVNTDKQQARRIDEANSALGSVSTTRGMNVNTDKQQVGRAEEANNALMGVSTTRGMNVNTDKQSVGRSEEANSALSGVSTTRGMNANDGNQPVESASMQKNSQALASLSQRVIAYRRSTEPEPGNKGRSTTDGQNNSDNLPSAPINTTRSNIKHPSARETSNNDNSVGGPSKSDQASAGSLSSYIAVANAKGNLQSARAAFEEGRYDAAYELARSAEAKVAAIRGIQK